MSVIKSQHIFLPKRHLDFSKWSVIACDQFTSDKEYWETVKNYVEGTPTTLDLIFPEIYLSNDNTERITQINKNMLTYFQNNILHDEGPCMILVDRKTSQHQRRLGIVMAVDLEEYSFKWEDSSLIKATEGTIVERIPPRVEIRKDAIFELPHIMLLYDDREQKIAEKLFEKRQELEEVYKFNLNMEGGSLTGYKIRDVEDVIKQFDVLLSPEYLQKTFNTDKPLLFAVGDGNHSLATAKEHWNRVKSFLNEEEKATHPARYALVEAVNIHDEGIQFSPIYRVIFNGGKKFAKGLNKLYKVNHKKAPEDSYKTYSYFVGDKEFNFDLPASSPMAIKVVQDYIDKQLGNRLEMSVDYIHGLQELKDICNKNKDAVGIVLPTIDKNDLFEFIIKYGVLPRKSFSIGEAREKRYYLEAHKIKLI